MVKSMTGFASRKGQGAGHSWSWDVRAVNGRGLDLRLRVPDWIDGLEQAVRSAFQARLSRGSVTVSLKLSRDASEGAEQIDEAALSAVLVALSRVQASAGRVGLALAPPSAVEIMEVRGVLSGGGGDVGTDEMLAALRADLDPLLKTLDQMRRAEGATLAVVLLGQLDKVESLVRDAATAAEARKDQMAETLRQNLARVLDNSEGADPARVAQELAMIAVKSDITEEIDRLGAHVQGARALLEEDGPVGRKLDFLTQEFNREANTLCSKAQSTELTRIGLDLKAVIDQMREQVQNVE